MLRTDVSFRSCLRETIAWTASTEQGSIFHTACITSFSKSASGGRMTAGILVGFVMVQLVPHAEAVAKQFFMDYAAPFANSPRQAVDGLARSVLTHAGQCIPLSDRIRTVTIA